MSHKNNAFSYPAMLRLAGRKCVIIGGGPVAARKLASLCEAGAVVTVVAPDFCEKLQQTAQLYPCTLIDDVYKSEYLADAFICVAATDSKEVNRQVTAAAPCLCNNITEPELSDFTVPSIITLGQIMLTVATGGNPALTRLLKSYLQRKLPPELDAFNQFLLEQREAVKHIPSSPKERTAFWREVLNNEIMILLEEGNLPQAKEKVINAVNRFRIKSQNSTC